MLWFWMEDKSLGFQCELQVGKGRKLQTSTVTWGNQAASSSSSSFSLVVYPFS